MPLSRIGRLVMDLSHSTSCTHKFSKKHTPTGHHQPLAWFLFQEDEDGFFFPLSKNIAGNIKTAHHGMVAGTVIQGQYVGHRRYTSMLLY